MDDRTSLGTLLSFSAPHVRPADIPANLPQLQALVARGGPQELISFLRKVGLAADDCRNISAAVEAFPPPAEHVEPPVCDAENGGKNCKEAPTDDDGEDEEEDNGAARSLPWLLLLLC